MKRNVQSHPKQLDQIHLHDSAAFQLYESGKRVCDADQNTSRRTRHTKRTAGVDDTQHIARVGGGGGHDKRRCVTAQRRGRHGVHLAAERDDGLAGNLYAKIATR